MAFTRQTKEEFSVLASAKIFSQHKIVTTYDRSYFAPLYVYSHDLLEKQDHAKQANFSPEFLAEVKTKVGRATPEQIFHYIYAILYSPGYRTRYAELLKRDFPRVPLTSDKTLFAKLATLGERLVNLHLMKADTDEMSRFPVAGSNEVVKVEFKLATQGELADAPSPQSSAARGKGSVNNLPPQLNSRIAHVEIVGRVYVNAAQYFDDVPKAVWEYHIGGYQVCQKWLKDRKGRQLSYDDIKHYHGIIAALAETIQLQARIDDAIPGWPLN